MPDLQRHARDLHVEIFDRRKQGIGAINETHAGKVDNIFICFWNDEQM